MAAFWLVVLMVIGSLFEVVGIASIPAFISLLESPDIVHKYEALAFLHEVSGAVSHEQFLLFAAIGLIAIFRDKKCLPGPAFCVPCAFHFLNAA